MAKPSTFSGAKNPWAYINFVQPYPWDIQWNFPGLPKTSIEPTNLLANLASQTFTWNPKASDWLKPLIWTDEQMNITQVHKINIYPNLS